MNQRSSRHTQFPSSPIFHFCRRLVEDRGRVKKSVSEKDFPGRCHPSASQRGLWLAPYFFSNHKCLIWVLCCVPRTCLKVLPLLCFSVGLDIGELISESGVKCLWEEGGKEWASSVSPLTQTPQWEAGVWAFLAPTQGWLMRRAGAKWCPRPSLPNRQLMMLEEEALLWFYVSWLQDQEEGAPVLSVESRKPS